MIKSISEKRSNLRYLLPFFEIFAVKSSTIISLGFRFYHFGAISRVDFFDHEFFIFLPVMSDDVIVISGLCILEFRSDRKMKN